MSLTTQNTLTEIVKTDFRSARIFEKYNSDFCCKGNRAFVEPLPGKRKLNADEIFSEVIAVCNQHGSGKDSYVWKTDELANHILNTHHVYIKKMLPVIFAHSQKVSEVHGIIT